MTRLITIAFVSAFIAGFPALAVEPLNNGVHKDLDYIMSDRLDHYAGGGSTFSGTSYSDQALLEAEGAKLEAKRKKEQDKIRKDIAEKNKNKQSQESSKDEGKTSSKSKKNQNNSYRLSPLSPPLWRAFIYPCC